MGEVRVFPLDGYLETYREVKNGFIVKREKDDTLTCEKIEEKDTRRDLTLGEISKALDMGLEVPSFKIMKDVYSIDL